MYSGLKKSSASQKSPVERLSELQNSNSAFSSSLDFLRSFISKLDIGDFQVRINLEKLMEKHSENIKRNFPEIHKILQAYLETSVAIFKGSDATITLNPVLIQQLKLIARIENGEQPDVRKETIKGDDGFERSVLSCTDALSPQQNHLLFRRILGCMRSIFQSKAESEWILNDLAYTAHAALGYHLTGTISSARSPAHLNFTELKSDLEDWRTNLVELRLRRVYDSSNKLSKVKRMQLALLDAENGHIDPKYGLSTSGPHYNAYLNKKKEAAVPKLEIVSAREEAFTAVEPRTIGALSGDQRGNFIESILNESREALRENFNETQDLYKVSWSSHSKTAHGLIFNGSRVTAMQHDQIGIRDSVSGASSTLGSYRRVKEFTGNNNLDHEILIYVLRGTKVEVYPQIAHEECGDTGFW